MKPRRIYVRAKLLSFSSLEMTHVEGASPLKLIDSEACGFMLAYPSRGKFERAHPGETPIVFEMIGPAALEGRVGACPVCSKAFKLNSAGRMPSHGPPGDRCDGARREPKIDGPRVRSESRPPMSGGPIVGEPI